jgi:homoserine kinase type II
MDHKTILSKWDINFRNVLDISIQGSPERSTFRTVIEDSLCDKYILEEISANQRRRKKIISEMLSNLKRNKMGVEPYRKSSDQEYIVEYDGKHYQLQRFIGGIELPRPEYVKDSWRGKELAAFLLDLKKLNMPADNDLDIRSYVEEISASIKKHFPDIYDEIVPVIGFLENNLFKIIDSLPLSFCHGDYHPINVIWGEESINSVIDWEFFGARPELYDAANMLGCVGMENPNYLTCELATAFISELRKGDYQAVSWEYLTDLIIANRFAWLSEWCRKDDLEMQELEVIYMKLLIDSKKDLMKSWKIK